MVFRVRLCAQPSSQVGVILYYLIKCFQISTTGTEALAQLPMKESFLRYQPKNPDQQWPPNHIRMVFLNNKVAKLLQNIFHHYFEIKIQFSQYTNWVQIMSWYMNIYQYVKCHWGFQNLPTWSGHPNSWVSAFCTRPQFHFPGKKLNGSHQQRNFPFQFFVPKWSE